MSLGTHAEQASLESEWTCCLPIPTLVLEAWLVGGAQWGEAPGLQMGGGAVAMQSGSRPVRRFPGEVSFPGCGPRPPRWEASAF